MDITGTINPLAPVAFLDMKGKADGVELTHLSPYSGKYTGYPITKGRLTMDVHYQLDNGKLSADNHIFIDQLTFGDRIEGPGISHLPVKLAVALLKNSQGQIDVHVPVSGSLDDPKFSVGGLIWHAFVNLIGRAVTSPFRLLASAMGGGSSRIWATWSSRPARPCSMRQAQDRLGQIVKILQTKALAEAGHHRPHRSEVRRERPAQGDGRRAGPAGRPAMTTSVDPTSKLTPGRVRQVSETAYKHAKFPKPRELIGLTKSQPPDVMRKLLETNMPVDADALRQLGRTPRRCGARSGCTASSTDKRVFVLAPKLDAKGIDDKGKTTRVDFGLH